MHSVRNDTRNESLFRSAVPPLSFSRERRAEQARTRPPILDSQALGEKLWPRTPASAGHLLGASIQLSFDDRRVVWALSGGDHQKRLKLFELLLAQ
jgi:hypothetical protein